MLATPGSQLPELSWQQRLTSIMGHFDKSEIDTFMNETARPAIEAVSEEMRESGFAPEIDQAADCIEITVPHGERGAFRYTVRSRPFRLPSFVWAERRKEADAESRHYRAMAHTSEGETQHDVTGFSRDQLINDLLNRYARFRHSRRIG